MLINICYLSGERLFFYGHDGHYGQCGHKVETLVDKYLDAGKHTVIWDAEDFGSGIYFIYFESGEMSKVKKITLLK